MAIWCEELTHLKRPWYWERWKAWGEADDREWDGWIASPTQWLWVWANCRSWWWTGRPGVLQSMGLQRVGHDWVTEQQLQQRFYSTPKIFPGGWFYCGNTGSTIILKLRVPRAGRTGNSIHGSVKLCISFWYRIIFMQDWTKTHGCPKHAIMLVFFCTDTA